MSEERIKASLLMRVIAKSLDLIIIAIANMVAPHAGYLFGIIYLLISDGLFDGRSFGKKVLGLRVISVSTGNSGTFKDSILRNTTLAAALLLYKIPLLGWLFLVFIFTVELLLMLGNKDGMRLGDDLANTEVIES